MNAVKRHHKRHLRTGFLALAATATFIWSAIDIFGVDPQELLRFFTMSLVGLSVLVAMAAILVVAMKILRRRP